jgi:hypothetical protein
MPNPSRTQKSSGPKQRPVGAAIAGLVVEDALRTWVVPVIASTVIVVCGGLSAAEMAPTSTLLAIGILAALVLLLYIGERPLLAPDTPSRDRAIGAGLALVWLVACYLPFHLRLYPGTPLVNTVELSGPGHGLPITIPATGHTRLDLLFEGKLGHAPTGAALPVTYRMTIEGGDHQTQVISGRFDETLRTQRLGRRGSTIVHQEHVAEVHGLLNPAAQEMTIKELTLEPADSPPITITVYADPLPPRVVLVLGALALLAAALAFDRRGPGTETDGALTIATAAVIGTVVVFWTSNTVHPDFHTLIGAAIFGGGLIGFAPGAFLWWVAKRVVAPVER